MAIRLRDADFTVLLRGKGAEFDCALPRPIIAGGVDVWKCSLRSAHVPMTFLNMPGGFISYRAKENEGPWVTARVTPARVLERGSLGYYLLKDVSFKDDVKITEQRGERLAFRLSDVNSQFLVHDGRLAEFFGLVPDYIYKGTFITGAIDLYRGFRNLRFGVDCIYGSIIGQDIADVLALIPLKYSDEQISFIQFSQILPEWHVSDSVRIQRIRYQLRDQYNKLVEFVDGSAHCEFQLQFKLHSVGA